MPTVHKTLTGTSAVDIVKPPKHRKVKVRFIRVYNAGSSDSVVTLQQVSPDGSLTKDVDEIPITNGQTEIIDGCSAIYDLDRGFKLTGALDAAGTVNITVTYELV